MDSRTKQRVLTAVVILASILLIALGFFGFNLVAALLIICVIWALYFYFMTK